MRWFTIDILYTRRQKRGRFAFFASTRGTFIRYHPLLDLLYQENWEILTGGPRVQRHAGSQHTYEGLTPCYMSILNLPAAISQSLGDLRITQTATYVEFVHVI